MNYSRQFQYKEGTFCFLSNMYNFLSFYNIKINEAQLGGLLGYMGFYYSNKEQSSNEVVHGRSGNFRYLFDCLQTQLATTLNHIELDINDNYIRKINEFLRCFGILITWINNYYLEYSIYHNKSDFWSFVIVLNIDDNEVTLFDNGIRKISLDAFLKATDNQKKGLIYYSVVMELNWKSKEKDLICQGFHKCLDRFNTSIDNNEDYYGIQGMKKFINGIDNCVNTDKLYNFYFQLSRPGGVIVSRRMMIFFLDELNTKYSLSYAINCMKIYQTLEEEWRKVSNLLYRLSNCLDEDLKSRIIERIEKIIQLEEKGLEVIESLTMELEEIK